MQQTFKLIQNKVFKKHNYMFLNSTKSSLLKKHIN